MKAREKVAVICNQDPLKDASGASTLSRSVIEYVRHKGVDVHVLYLTGKTHDVSAYPKIHPFKSHLFQNISPGLLKHVLRSDYDAYVIIGFGELTISLLMMWLKFRSKIVILLPMWHHDMIFNTHVAKWLFHLKRKLVDFPTFRLGAGTVICQSDYERRSLLYYSKRTALIPLGINIREPIWPSCWEIRRLKASPDSELKIITSGRLGAGKIPLYFLRVIHRLRERRPVKFQILAARIDNKYFQRFVSEIQRLELNEVVDIVDVSSLSRATVFARLVQGDVAVCPSYSEAFGLSAVEYSYSGIPVVATRTGVVEYLEGKNCLFAADWGDINGMVNAIVKASNMSPHECENMSRTARHVIETEFTDERFLDTLWRVLERQFKDGSR